ncbi:MAG TPA: hypothetical protein VK462_04650 [Nitrososphaeraceae archaeon]|nr:hypothetical protein [Nitrososphaeraceae archaeon]
MNNIINQTPYLRTSQEFPEDLPQLCVQINRSYIETATAVNYRTIGIFPKNRPAVTGESWYLTSQRQQTLRQIYSFGAIAPGTELDIPHGLDINNVVIFTRIYGTVITNGIDYRPLPYVDPTTLTTGMAILVNPSVIRIVLGTTAQPVTSGIAVLEWLSNV